MHKKPLVGGVRPQAENSLDHLEDAASCPRLRNIGPAWVERGKVNIALTLQACKHLGRAIGIKTLNGIEHPTDDLIRLIGQPITLKACCDNAVVMRPDRPKLVGERVIGWIFA